MKAKVYLFYSLTKRAFVQVTAQKQKAREIICKKKILNENLQLEEITILRTTNSQQQSIEMTYPEIF